MVTVAHRDADVRYPILLDPTILEDHGFWFSSTGIDLTGWMYTNPSGHFPYFYGAAYLGNGLYIYNRGSRPFNAGDYANWYFNAPGTSRIVRADFGYVKHEPQTTGTLARALQRRPHLPGRLELHAQPLRDRHVVRGRRGRRRVRALAVLAPTAR